MRGCLILVFLGAQVTVRDVFGDQHEAITAARAIAAKIPTARVQVYPFDPVLIYDSYWTEGTCQHCGDGTEREEDPLPDLCAMCEKAGRTWPVPS